MWELPQCTSYCSFVSVEETPGHVVQIKEKPKSKPAKKTKKKRKMTQEELAHLENYQAHKDRILTIQSNLDNKPPEMNPTQVTGVASLRRNADHYLAYTKKTMQALVELSRTMRTHGDINPFRYDRVYAVSALPVAMKALDRIDMENRDIGKRLKDVVSGIDTGRKTKGQHSKKIPHYKQPFIMSGNGLAKYQGYKINMPATDVERWQLLRPHIYFDIYLKDSRPLGRVVAQLYTEAAPAVVLHLVKACQCNLHRQLEIKRLFPNLWLDVVMKNDNARLTQPLEYDAKIIDHGACSYVLSFSKECLQGFKFGVTFSISFRALGVVNGSRVGFGKVIKGQKILDCLQAYGTKNGKLSRSIIFTECGLL